MTEDSQRLSRSKWLDHSLAQLAEHGPQALKADTLCRSIGVSRGSFYWHFKSLAKFQDALLDHWRQVKVVATITQLETGGGSAIDRLRTLIEFAVGADRELEGAMRAWAVASPRVADAVRELDAQAMGYVEALLLEAGLSATVAKSRAHIIYSAYLGQAIMGTLTPEEQTRVVTELIVLAKS